MNLIIQEFESRPVRIVYREDGIPIFIGKDVADILGYSNSRDALATHVWEEYQIDGVAIHDGVKVRYMTGLTESGVYQLIFSSGLESAKRFQRWLIEIVLPSIRQTGSYSLVKKDNTFDLVDETIKRLVEKFVVPFSSVVDSIGDRVSTLNQKVDSLAVPQNYKLISVYLKETKVELVGNGLHHSLNCAIKKSAEKTGEFFYRSSDGQTFYPDYLIAQKLEELKAKHNLIEVVAKTKSGKPRKNAITYLQKDTISNVDIEDAVITRKVINDLVKEIAEERNKKLPAIYNNAYCKWEKHPSIVNYFNGIVSLEKIKARMGASSKLDVIEKVDNGLLVLKEVLESIRH